MALTELQMPSKEDFYNNVRSIADSVRRSLAQYESAADFIGRMGTADMDAMGIATGQVRTDLANFRTMLDEIVELLNGNAVTPTNSPKEVVDALRRMNII